MGLHRGSNAMLLLHVAHGEEHIRSDVLGMGQAVRAIGPALSRVVRHGNYMVARNQSSVCGLSNSNRRHSAYL